MTREDVDHLSRGMAVILNQLEKMGQGSADLNAFSMYLHGLAPSQVCDSVAEVQGESNVSTESQAYCAWLTQLPRDEPYSTVSLYRTNSKSAPDTRPDNVPSMYRIGKLWALNTVTCYTSSKKQKKKTKHSHSGKMNTSIFNISLRTQKHNQKGKFWFR